MRHAELQRLDWGDLKRDGDLIEIRAAKAKTASRRVIPILPNLRAWLAPYWQSSGAVCDYLDITKQFAELTKRVNERRDWLGSRSAVLAMLTGPMEELANQEPRRAWRTDRGQVACTLGETTGQRGSSVGSTTPCGTRSAATESPQRRTSPRWPLKPAIRRR